MTEMLQADAAVLQEKDSFTGTGWIKVIAPAKVNLHLAIGRKREDGYHKAVSIMHALALHDVVYMRTLAPEAYDAPGIVRAGEFTARIRMVGCGDVAAPDVPPEKNVALRAACALHEALPASHKERCGTGVDIRIEKNIPDQAGLGGGSSDAAAVLVGLVRLWGLVAADPPLRDETLVKVAASLGADVPFFLKGGCAYLQGTGDLFDHALEPRREAIVLVKPETGVSTPAAYSAFDEQPVPIPADRAERARDAQDASEIALFNNLAPAAESLMPALAEIRAWLESRPGVYAALLSGSGSATFAICESFDAACRIAAEARARGLWSRTTAFSPIRALVLA